jgi:hypothetical protein
MEKQSNDKFWNLKMAILLSIFLSGSLIIYTHFRTTQVDSYKKTFKGESIALTTRIKKDKVSFLKYYFYSDYKILSSVKNGNHEFVNKFYKVKYNLKNPKENYIVLDKELKPDSITLVKAGFTKIKYYIYDAGVTSKYMEKSKWK